MEGWRGPGLSPSSRRSRCEARMAVEEGLVAVEGRDVEGPPQSYKKLQGMKCSTRAWEGVTLE